MTLSKPRIEPLQVDQWNHEAQESLRRFGDPQTPEGQIPNMLKTMAHHPKLMSGMLAFGEHIFKSNTLPARVRELLILRIAWLCQAEYAWGQHVSLGRRIGLTDEEIRQIKAGPDAPEWDERDRLLLKATDELHTDSYISAAVWQGLSRYYNIQQLMDVVHTVGLYTVASMALNTFGVQPEAGLPTFADI